MFDRTVRLSQIEGRRRVAGLVNKQDLEAITYTKSCTCGERSQHLSLLNMQAGFEHTRTARCHSPVCSSVKNEDKMSKRQAEPTTESATAKQRPVRTLLRVCSSRSKFVFKLKFERPGEPSRERSCATDEQTGLECAKIAILGYRQNYCVGHREIGCDEERRVRGSYVDPNHTPKRY